MPDDTRSRAERILNGTPEEQIRAWVEPSDGTIADPALQSLDKDWCDTLLPSLSFHSTSTTPNPTATFTFRVEEHHCNRLRNLHGGCAASLFDYLTTLSLCLVDPKRKWRLLGVTRTLNVTYYRPVPLGSEVLIECTVADLGRSLCLLRGEMRRKEDGVLLCSCEHQKFNIDPKI